MNKTSAKTFIITAPSGTGKSTVNRRLVDDLENLAFSVSYTTREKRPDEVNGVHYWFVTQKEFKQLILEDQMIEWAEVFGNYYGTSRKEIERINSQNKSVLLEIDVQGWLSLKDKTPNLVSLFMLPPSIKELWERLTTRGTESTEVAIKRFKKAQLELAIGKGFENFIINDDFEKTYESVKKFVYSDKAMSLSQEEGKTYCDKLLAEFETFKI